MSAWVSACGGTAPRNATVAQTDQKQNGRDSTWLIKWRVRSNIMREAHLQTWKRAVWRPPQNYDFKNIPFTSKIYLHAYIYIQYIQHFTLPQFAHNLKCTMKSDFSLNNIKSNSFKLVYLYLQWILVWWTLL